MAARDVLEDAFPPGPGPAPGPMGHGSVPHKRRPGRPVKESGEYTKGYLRTKQWRERHKASVDGLSAELADKLAQVVTLSTENEVLKLREEVLQQSILAVGEAQGRSGPLPGVVADGSGPTSSPGSQASSGSSASSGGDGRTGAAMTNSTVTDPLLGQFELTCDAVSAPILGGAALASSLQLPPSPPPWHQQQQRQEAEQHGALVKTDLDGPLQQEWRPLPAPWQPPQQDGCGQQSQGQGEAQAPRAPRQRSAEFAALVELHTAIYERLRQRAEKMEAGTWPEGESPFQVPQHTMLRRFAALDAQEMRTFISTDMATGEVVQVPEGLWREVAEGVVLSAEQEQRASAAFDAFFAQMGRVMAERRVLQQQLAEAMAAANASRAVAASEPPPAPACEMPGLPCCPLAPPSAHIAGPGDGDRIIAAVECDRLLQELRANMVREDQAWNTAAWTLKMIADPEPLATCILRSWPFWPRLIFIFASKLGRKLSPPARPPGPQLAMSQDTAAVAPF